MPVHQFGESCFLPTRSEALQEVSVCPVCAWLRTHQVANLAEHSAQWVSCHVLRFSDQPCSHKIVARTPQTGTVFWGCWQRQEFDYGGQTG
jgi:hypothetical protein